MRKIEMKFPLMMNKQTKLSHQTQSHRGLPTGRCPTGDSGRWSGWAEITEPVEVDKEPGKYKITEPVGVDDNSSHFQLNIYCKHVCNEEYELWITININQNYNRIDENYSLSNKELEESICQRLERQVVSKTAFEKDECTFIVWYE